ncbi:hypothetical protein ACFVV7_36795 [Streptomyces globisporus]|uniref:hypothetical protein n=1 Tax=Streptomyces globisporus TaxID=1908 RepID=UPI0036DBEAC5
MSGTTTGTTTLAQRLREIAEHVADHARRATGQQESDLWAAASLWTIAAEDARGSVTPELVAVAMRADARAAEGGYQGPWFAQELVKRAQPTPRVARPRVAITHLGRVEVPDDFEC